MSLLRWIYQPFIKIHKHDLSLFVRQFHLWGTYQIEVCSWCLCGNVTELIFPSVVPLSLSTLSFPFHFGKVRSTTELGSHVRSQKPGDKLPTVRSPGMLQTCLVRSALTQRFILLLRPEIGFITQHVFNYSSLKPLLIQNADGASCFSRSWGYPSFPSWATRCFIWKTTCSLVLAMTSKHWSLARWPWCSSIPQSTGSSL